MYYNGMPVSLYTKVVTEDQAFFSKTGEEIKAIAEDWEQYIAEPI